MAATITITSHHIASPLARNKPVKRGMSYQRKSTGSSKAQAAGNKSRTWTKKE